MYKPLTDWRKKYLGPKVEKVQVSNKLDDDPLFILTSQYGFSASMEKVNRMQAFQNQEKAAGYMMARKTLEINPHHGVMKEMLQMIKDAEDEKDPVDDKTKDMATLMYNMALLNSGFNIDDPDAMTSPLQRMINVGFGLERIHEIEEIEVDIDEDEAQDADTPPEDVEEIDLGGFSAEEVPIDL